MKKIVVLLILTMFGLISCVSINTPSKPGDKNLPGTDETPKEDHPISDGIVGSDDDDVDDPYEQYFAVIHDVKAFYWYGWELYNQENIIEYNKISPSEIDIASVSINEALEEELINRKLNRVFNTSHSRFVSVESIVRKEVVVYNEALYIQYMFEDILIEEETDLVVDGVPQTKMRPAAACFLIPLELLQQAL